MYREQSALWCYHWYPSLYTGYWLLEKRHRVVGIVSSVFKYLLQILCTCIYNIWYFTWVIFLFKAIIMLSCGFFRGGEQTISELIKQKLHLNKEPVVVNVLAVLLVSVLIIVSYAVRRESLKRRPNNKTSYTATVSPLRIKSSSSSTGKFGSGKQSSQPPVWDAYTHISQQFLPSLLHIK